MGWGIKLWDTLYSQQIIGDLAFNLIIGNCQKTVDIWNIKQHASLKRKQTQSLLSNNLWKKKEKGKIKRKKEIGKLKNKYTIDEIYIYTNWVEQRNKVNCTALTKTQGDIKEYLRL